MMLDSFNEQKANVVVWQATNNTFNVQSSLWKMVTPAQKFLDTLSTVTMISSILLKGWFGHTQLTTIPSTVGGICWWKGISSSFFVIEFTRPVLELEFNFTSNDKDEGTKRNADQMTTIINNWLTYPNSVKNCYTE